MINSKKKLFTFKSATFFRIFTFSFLALILLLGTSTPAHSYFRESHSNSNSKASSLIEMEVLFLESAYLLLDLFQMPYFSLVSIKSNLQEEKKKGQITSTEYQNLFHLIEILTQLKEKDAFDPDLVKRALELRAEAKGSSHGGIPFGISKLEIAALVEYSGSEYAKINSILRNQKNIPQDILIFRDFMNRTLEKLPDYQGTVKRGIKVFPGWDKIYVQNATIIEQTPSKFHKTII